MHSNRHVAGVCLGLAMFVAAHAALAQTQSRAAIDEIRKELMQLPYYGVFDFIAFSYDRGTVTLVGYAYHPMLKTDAERAVKRAPGVRAPGVDEVKDKIEDLPVSPNDDELRWKTYYAIYRDPFLSRYAPGGGMLWGHRHAFGLGFHPLGPGGPFPGMEPAGDYPIHIIVKKRAHYAARGGRQRKRQDACRHEGA
jgi:hypothetical protein